MTLLSVILFLLVIAVLIYAIRLAFAGDWKSLVYLAVGVIVAVWVLQIIGVSLPIIPRVS